MALADLSDVGKLVLSKVAQNLWLTLILAYLVGLIAYYLESGLFFQFTLGAYGLIALPMIWLLGRSREFFKSWVPLLILLLSYEALNGIAGSIAASGNLVSLASLDRLMFGFNLTGTVQTLWNSASLTILFVFLYSLHLPLVLIASIFFWYTDKATYGKYASTLVITSYFALLTFVIVPTAPPWYEGLAKDLMQDSQGPSVLFSSTLAKLSSLIESDKFAAFPSLHSAYITLFSYYTMRYRLVLGAISLPLFVGMLLSTIYLGQHYVIDLVAGSAYALSVALLVNRVPILRKAFGFQH